MAILNTEKNQIVIRLVYDGLALSGKTTSLKMLAGSLDQNFYSPEEKYGRTVYFDWVGYTGGLFEGYQIRCQIVSVPGQDNWGMRRERLIDSADVIIFVGDTTRGRFSDSLLRLKELYKTLQQRPGPPVGIIFQANKRDMADTVPLAEIQRELGNAIRDIAIIESIASEGSGVRQAFVFGVRLCLDRVRELIRTDSLPEGAPEIDTGEDLLRELREAEEAAWSESSSQPSSVMAAASPDGIVAARVDSLATGDHEFNPSADDALGGLADEALEEVLLAEVESPLALIPCEAADGLNDDSPLNIDDSPIDVEALAALRPPLPPSADVPSGMIWPPVEGRIIVSEALLSPPGLCRSENGDWTNCTPGRWIFHSYEKDLFDDLSTARKALINWAHRHITVMPILSPTRALVLSETGHGDWRLWQVVRVESSLLSLSTEALGATDPLHIADGIWGTAYMYLTAQEQFRALRTRLPFSLDNIGLMDGNIRYNGLIPSPALPELGTDKVEDNTVVLDGEEELRAQIKNMITVRLSSQGNGLEAAIDAISRRGDGSKRSRKAFEITCDLLREIVMDA